VAVPGKASDSFRVGMAGITVLLRQGDLAPIAGATGEAPIGSVFHWMMGASVVYGDGTLFLAQDDGLVACIDPQTGQVRGSETLPSSPQGDESISVLAVDGSAGLVDGHLEIRRNGIDLAGVVGSPPSERSARLSIGHSSARVIVIEATVASIPGPLTTDVMVDTRCSMTTLRAAHAPLGE
jgi:hypothetical protein